jgi:3-hydroxyacyl-CoA dehydrogenase
LVESGVGLIPGWGGCIRYLHRCASDPQRKGGPIPPVRKAFENILMPQHSVSTSAADARNKLWLRTEDGVTMNSERLLSDAKTRALTLAENYTPPAPMTFKLPGPAGKAALKMAIDDFYTKGDATWHDVVVADALADVLTGAATNAGNVLDETELARLEREHFLSLLRTEQTRKRVAHTLKTGKPLREEVLHDGKSLDDIRTIRKAGKLAERKMDGQPLQGSAAFQLRLMAEISAFLLRRFAG